MNLSKHEIKIIEDIYQHINCNFKNHILIIELVKKHQISDSTLTKGFKALYQKTMYRYRLEKCMEYAKRQIQQGVQIKTIQQELHYTTTGSFARAFKNIHGYSPTQTNKQPPL